MQDLKQIGNWSSKERLTTQVIYDRFKQCYVAAFNERKIRVWSEEEANLNNVKGYKFQSSIYAILQYDDLPPILVQQNGATASLEWAIANRKTWTSKGITKARENLLDCQLIFLNGRTSLFCLTKIEEVYNYIIVKLEDGTCLEKADTLKRIELKRRSEDLVGHVVIHYKNNAYLLTLCMYDQSLDAKFNYFFFIVRCISRYHCEIISGSHGRLYSHFLTGTSSDPESSKLISVITNINTNYPVVMMHLNETTIAVYGADVTDEGAILMIYNVQFKLVQAAQKLKLYTYDAKLWKVEDKLLLAANRHLTVAPYHLAPQRTAAMLGSSLCFKNNENDADDIMVIQEAAMTQWKDKNQKQAKHSLGQIPSNIPKQIRTYLNEGSSDIVIQEMILSLMESGDVASIRWCLDTFENLSEKLLVHLLEFTLNRPDKAFVPVQNGTADNKSKANNLYSKNSFLDKIFSIKYSTVSLLPHLKTGLTFDKVLKLLEYLMYKLNEEMDSLDNNLEPSDQQLYGWFCMLLDSHYQHYLLSQDPHVLELFNRLNSILEEHVCQKTILHMYNILFLFYI